MELIFALIYDGKRLDISEPVGFDSFEPELERNDMHGVSVEYSDIDLEFTDCDAIDIIKQKYESSLDSEVEFVVEMKCKNDFDEIYRGRLDLSTYQFLTKEYTSVKCKVGQVGVFTTFNNRLDTDVCLDDLTSLDGSALNDYDFMNYDVEVPGKVVISNARTSDILTDEYIPQYFNFIGGELYALCVPGMMNSEGDDLGGFGYSYINIFTGTAESLSKIKPFFERQNASVDIIASQINYLISFKLRIETTNPDYLKYVEFRGKAKLILFNETENVLAESIDPIISPVTSGDNYHEYNVLFGGSYNNLIFRELYVRVDLSVFVSASVTQKVLDTFSMKTKSGNQYFSITHHSIFPASNAKTFMLHEALSRISESITDKALQVYSNYYGRIDSGKAGEQKLLNEVYSDGEGSLRCLTNGYKLRNYIYTNGDMPRMYLSMKKAINSLAAIDNIGCGFSFEKNKWVVRVENWKWFYNDTPLFEINNPSNVTRRLNADEVNSRLHVGYKKYAELSESNVVDTFYSERKYSTLLKAVDKNVSAISDFVADAYAIEYTRRKSIDKDTKDWSYDEDAFIICLLGANISEKQISTGETISSVFKFIVDNGMTDADNSVVSPETMLNVHISPARNAERWADRMSQYPGANGLRYISGTRNTNAKGKPNLRVNPTIELIGAGAIERTTHYRQKHDILIAENVDIPLVNAHLKAEIMEFDYPITLVEFNQIRLNPYGYILVDGEKCYLKSVKYNFKSSIANFVLIPKAL